MKKYIALICIVAMLFLMTGCISGEIVKANDFLTNVKVLRYVSAEEEGGELVWNGTDRDENGNPIPVPTVDEMMGTEMRMDNYMKIQFNIKGDPDAVITAIKFNVVADREGMLRITIRDNLDLTKEPLFVKVFNLEANKGDGFVLAGLELTTKSKCLYIGNEPPLDNIKDYDGYKMKWKIKDLELVTA